jgi:FkbM family methyltransferase
MRTIEHFFRKTRFCLDALGLRRLSNAARPMYYRMLGLLYPRGVPRFIHGEPALYFTPDARGVPEDLDTASFLTMKERIKEGAVILDLGANVGMYSLLLARWAGPTGKVFAFEPAAGIADKLRRHVVLNKLTERIEVIQAAVGDVVGEVTFYTAGLSGHSSVNAAAVVGGQAHPVAVTTVDAFCKTHGITPTFLKIDVEGYEAHVLEGARDTIQRCTPDMLIETHPGLWEGLLRTREQIAERLDGLKKQGYYLVNLDGVDPLVTEAHLLCQSPAA